MRRRDLFALAALALAVAALAVDASAEEINFATATAERPNLLQARTGIDHALVLELGYRRVVEWGGHQILFGGDLTVPSAGLDLGDYRARASVAASLLGGSGRGWRLSRRSARRCARRGTPPEPTPPWAPTSG